MSGTMYAVDVDEDTFQAAVLDASRDRGVVLCLHAAWSSASAMVVQVLEALVDEDHGRWRLAKVDAARHPTLVQRYAPRDLPAVYALRDGQVVASFVGARPHGAVREWLSEQLPDVSADRAREGDQALHAGDAARAVLLFQEAMALDPSSVQARLGLSELALDHDDPEGAVALLAELDVPPSLEDRLERLVQRLEAIDDPSVLRAKVAADPGDLLARWDLAHALAAGADPDGALAQLLAIVVKDRKFRQDGARREMLRLFESLGTRSPISDRWRAALAKALY